MKSRYFEKISRKSIIVCGIYPPPYGGVSVHIQRVIDALSMAHNKLFFFNVEHSSRFFFPFYLVRLLKVLIQHRPSYIHYHATYLRTMLFDLLFLHVCSYLFRYDVTIIDHDCRHLYARGRFAKWLYTVVASRVKVVMIGQTVAQSYTENGINTKEHTVESAFLPPSVQRAPSVQSTYPSSLFLFIQEHTPVLLMNAAHIMIRNGKDIYGFDTAVEMIAHLKKQYPDAGLIIALAQTNDASYLEHLYKKMQMLDCAEQIYILQNQKELWPLFDYTDLFIRPTLSDGMSVSIDEALFFNVPVVASNAADRRNSVYVYPVDDIETCVQVVKSVLQEQVYGADSKRNNMHQKSH